MICTRAKCPPLRIAMYSSSTLLHKEGELFTNTIYQSVPRHGNFVSMLYPVDVWPLNKALHSMTAVLPNTCIFMRSIDTDHLSLKQNCCKTQS